MDINTFTQKSQQAILAARDDAAGRQHQAAAPAHLLGALLAQTDTVIYPLLAKLGANPATLRSAVETELNKIPKLYGDTPEVGVSNETIAVLDAATTEATAMKDQYVSVEHILISLSLGTEAIGRRHEGLAPRRARRGTRSATGHEPEPGRHAGSVGEVRARPRDARRPGQARSGDRA